MDVRTDGNWSTDRLSRHFRVDWSQWIKLCARTAIYGNAMPFANFVIADRRHQRRKNAATLSMKLQISRGSPCRRQLVIENDPILWTYITVSAVTASIADVRLRCPFRCGKIYFLSTEIFPNVRFRVINVLNVVPIILNYFEFLIVE